VMAIVCVILAIRMRRLAIKMTPLTVKDVT